MRLLVTGFGPFPGIRVNPSAAVARAVARDRRLKALGITAAMVLIETTYATAEALIPEVVARCRPEAVLMFGVASKRKALCVETRAKNRVSILHPDAAGIVPRRLTPFAGAPFALRGRAPVARLVVAGRRAGVKTRASISAGTYLCNDSYWRMLAASGPSTPCVFLHIPKVRGRAMMRRLTEAGVQAALMLVRAARTVPTS